MNSSMRLQRLPNFLPFLIIAAAIALLASGAHGNGDDDEAAHESKPAPSAGYPDSLLARLNEAYQAVKPIMVTSCYDCHSNKPDYPWYHAIPGVQQFMDDHIAEATEHLDMSNDFPFTGEHGLKASLNDIKAEIYDGEMPLCSYLIMHWGTEVTGDRRDSLFSWIDASLAALKEYDRTAALMRPSSDTGQ